MYRTGTICFIAKEFGPKLIIFFGVEISTGC